MWFLQKKCYIALLGLLLIVGCGNSSSGKSPASSSILPANGDIQRVGEDTEDALEKESLNSASCKITQEHFEDRFVQEARADIPWSESKFTALSTKEIENAFNRAREADSTVAKVLVLPSQKEWDQMSSSQKALFLINSERCARGIVPFEGADEKVVQTAQWYASFLADHKDSYEQDPHRADGRDPWQRLAEIGGVKVGENADFFSYGENIAYQAVASTANYPKKIYEAVAKSVYGWLYEDRTSHYGHRKFLLATGLVENFGQKGKEGLIGIGSAVQKYTTTSNGNTFYWVKQFTVLNAFDPNEKWHQ